MLEEALDIMSKHGACKVTTSSVEIALLAAARREDDVGCHEASEPPERRWPPQLGDVRALNAAKSAVTDRRRARRHMRSKAEAAYEAILNLKVWLVLRLHAAGRGIAAHTLKLLHVTGAYIKNRFAEKLCNLA